jgi:hypothetical protein
MDKVNACPKIKNGPKSFSGVFGGNYIIVG